MLHCKPQPLRLAHAGIVQEGLGELLLYESSKTESGDTTSLKDYVERMPDSQSQLYYLVAPSRAIGEASPYYDTFKEKVDEAHLASALLV